MASAQDFGLSAEDGLSRVYLQIADDRLHGRLPAQVSESQLRERYGLDPRATDDHADPHLSGGLGRASPRLWLGVLGDAGDAGGAAADLSGADGARARSPARARLPPRASRHRAAARGRARLLDGHSRRSARRAARAGRPLSRGHRRRHAAIRSSSTRCAGSTASAGCSPIAAWSCAIATASSAASISISWACSSRTGTRRRPRRFARTWSRPSATSIGSVR